MTWLSKPKTRAKGDDDAIEAYHKLLTPDVADDSQSQLDDQLRRRGLFFGQRALCTVLRPRFLSNQQYAFLQSACARILRAFRAAHEAALSSDTVLSQFRLDDWEHTLVRIDPGFRDASPVSRLDAFFVEQSGGLRFTEYNAETPAGGAYNDVLSDVFYGLPPMRAFSRTWDVRALPARHHVLHALLDAYEQWSGRRDRPRIAIIDWADVPTQSEFLLYQRYFHEQGIECEIAEPAELELANRALRSPRGRIDLIYKRVLLSELVERGGVDHPILEAVRTRAVCMVNPPSCKILHKKASLAVLHNERNEALFDDDMRQAIVDFVPWTRVVEERHTMFRDERIDLLHFIADHREQFVLKPNDAYGGKGIVLGWEVDNAEWQAAIATALEEPHIVQERIELPFESYPSMVDGRLAFSDRMVDTAPYVAYGSHVDGCLSRLASESLLNVTAGGGSQTPTFVVERR